MNRFDPLARLRDCALASRNFVTGLIGEITGTVADALEELANGKMDKTNAVAVTIPTSGWSEDASSASYPKYYDIAVAGVTASDRAEITIAPGSLGTAKACGLCPTNETLAGKIRVRATSIPEAAIAAEYWIADGKE